MINAPVLHVNGDHPEGTLVGSVDLHETERVDVDVYRALKIAFEYRNFFRKVSPSFS
jgi:hypothetical protein